jgi:hypothetical protein
MPSQKTVLAVCEPCASRFCSNTEDTKLCINGTVIPTPIMLTPKAMLPATKKHSPTCGYHAARLAQVQSMPPRPCMLPTQCCRLASAARSVLSASSLATKCSHPPHPSAQFLSGQAHTAINLRHLASLDQEHSAAAAHIVAQLHAASRRFKL